MTQTTTQAPDDGNTNDAPPSKGGYLTSKQALEWGNDVTIDEKPPVKEGAKILTHNDILAGKTGAEDDEDDTTDGAAASDDDSSDDDDNADVAEVASADTLETTVTLDNPGDYTPTDYSFDVVIYEGEEGKERPRTVKVKTVEDAEELLDKDPNFGSAKNLLTFNRKVTRMESGQERDKLDYDKRKNEYDKQVEADTERRTRIVTIANELQYLVGKGKLPAVAKEFRTADWTDPQIAKQPGVRDQIALLAYMEKENKARTKVGLSQLTSALDAYNAWRADEAEQAAVNKNKDDGMSRKKAGSRVAGTSAASQSAPNAPRGVSVGRVTGGGLRGLTSGW